MNKYVASSLLAASALATPAHGKEIRAIMGPIMAEAASAEVITRKCDMYVGAIEQRLEQISGSDGTASVDETLVAYDEMTALLGAASGEMTLYREVMLDAERRDAGADCEVRLSTLSSKINLSRSVYEKLAAIDASDADEETRHYLAKTLGEFERAGVALEADKRARVQAINEELAGLSAEFARNIAESVPELKVRPDELAGLPQDFIDAREADEDGFITLTTATPDYVPVLTYGENDDLRRRYAELYNRRAYPANDTVLRKIFTLRQELADLLGRPNYASLVLEDKMVNSPIKVQSLLDGMAAIARPVAQKDLQTNLEVLREIDPQAMQIEYWQTGWLSNKVKQARYDYNPQDARPYFSYPKVRDGILSLTEDLFQVTIRPWDTPVWHEDVDAFEMLDGDNVVGRFYFDSHPRPGKYTHANMIPLRPGVAGDPPVGALVQNFSKGLMEHGQVETFLHEFGHMLHGMFGGTQRWFGLSGITTEWDFVEAPSQMLENWVFDYDTLAKFATNEAGEVIPRELVEKMNRARYFNQGMGDMTQLGYSNISLQFHQQPLPDDFGAAAREWRNQYATIPAPEWVEMQSAFGHLDGYSAIYYTYRWSKVIADDLFTRFAAEGLRNPQTAADYRKLVLGRGGTLPAAQLVQDFLGREVSLDAYRAELEKGLD